MSGELYTAVQTWTRDPDHSVILIGTCHVGELDYYDTVECIVASHPEATVHYGFQVRESPPPSMTAVERWRLTASRAGVGALGRRWAAEMVGLASRNGLFVGKDWRNVDLAELDVLRLAQPSWWTVPGMRVEVGLAPEPTDRRFCFLARMLRCLLMQGMRWEHLAGRGAIWGWRDAHATTRVLRAVHNGPVVLIWDAGRLSHVGDLLSRNDFRLNRTQWVQAVRREPDAGLLARRRADNEENDLNENEVRS